MSFPPGRLFADVRAQGGVAHRAVDRFHERTERRPRVRRSGGDPGSELGQIHEERTGDARPDARDRAESFRTRLRSGSSVSSSSTFSSSRAMRRWRMSIRPAISRRKLREAARPRRSCPPRSDRGAGDASHEIGEQALAAAPNGRGLELDHGGEVGQEPSIDCVVLGQLAEPFAEAAHPPGVHEHHGKSAMAKASRSGRS
jgi:hypothetical protein